MRRIRNATQNVEVSVGEYGYLFCDGRANTVEVECSNGKRITVYDIVENGFAINAKSITGKKFQIGNCIADEMSVTLRNRTVPLVTDTSSSREDLRFVLDEDTFYDHADLTADYVFTYTDGEWTLDGEPVDIGHYGLKLTFGVTALDGDEIHIETEIGKKFSVEDFVQKWIRPVVSAFETVNDAQNRFEIVFQDFMVGKDGISVNGDTITLTALDRFIFLDKNVSKELMAVYFPEGGLLKNAFTTLSNLLELPIAVKWRTDVEPVNLNRPIGKLADNCTNLRQALVYCCEMAGVCARLRYDYDWESTTLELTNYTDKSFYISTSSHNGVPLAVTLDRDVFAEDVEHSGIYEFIYNGSGWELNGEVVDLGTYGITLTGSVFYSTDFITVNYIDKFEIYRFDSDVRISGEMYIQPFRPTGVVATVNGENVYASSNTAYAYEIIDNPVFYNTDDWYLRKDEIFDEIVTAYAQSTDFYPFTATTIHCALIEPFDILKYVRMGDDTEYTVAITEVSYQSGSSSAFAGDGYSETEDGSESSSTFTREQKAELDSVTNVLSVIGETITDNPDSENVSSSVYVPIATVDLTKGTWLLLATSAYYNNSTGSRYAGVGLLNPDGTLPSSFVAGARGMSQRVAALSGEYTVVQATKIVKVTAESEKYGSVSWQNSGTALLTYNGLTAVRIS